MRRAREHWGPDRRAAARQVEGNALRREGRYAEALACVEDALGDDAVALNDVAVVKRAAGDLDGAERDLWESLRSADGDRRGAATSTANLARLMLDRGRWQEAEQLARASFATTAGRKARIAANNRRIAAALIGQGSVAAARPNAEVAVELYAELGSPKRAGAAAVLARCGPGRSGERRLFVGAAAVTDEPTFCEAKCQSLVPDPRIGRTYVFQA